MKKKNLEELIPNTHRNDDEQRELTFQVLAGKGKSSLEKRRKAFVGLGKAKAKKRIQVTPPPARPRAARTQISN